MSHNLCPAQQLAYDGLVASLAIANVLVLQGDTGAGRICVMTTAMDVGNLPPALIRSGRIELWLETKLPDEAARAAILQDRVGLVPAVMGAVDVGRVAAETEGLTGADLKSLVEDAKILYAYDRANGQPLLPATDYFLKAAETVRANRERYAEADARARVQHPSRPPWFGMLNAMMPSMSFTMEEE